MPSKRPHLRGPEDHKQKQDPATKAEGRRAANQDREQPNDEYEQQPNLERRQDGDRSKRLPVELDADSSRGDPPHGYGTEAPQVQGGGKR